MHGIYFRISDGHVPTMSTLCGPADVRCNEGMTDQNQTNGELYPYKPKLPSASESVATKPP